MKVTAPPKKAKRLIGTVSKDKVIKKKAKGFVVTAGALERASETLPSSDKKRNLAKSKTKFVDKRVSETLPSLDKKSTKSRPKETLTGTREAQIVVPKGSDHHEKNSKKFIHKPGQEKSSKSVNSESLPSAPKDPKGGVIIEKRGGKYIPRSKRVPKSKRGPKKGADKLKPGSKKGADKLKPGSKKGADRLKPGSDGQIPLPLKEALLQHPIKPQLNLKRDILLKSCSSALQLLESQQKIKAGHQLFSEDPQDIFVQIQLFKVPDTPVNHFRCRVPHSIHPDPEVCLIVPDFFRGRRADVMNDKIRALYEARLAATKETRIKLLLPFAVLKAEYNQLEMQRRLVNSYDVFLCDGRIAKHVAHFLHKALTKPITPIRAVERKKFKKALNPKQKDIVHFSRSFKNDVDKALNKVHFVVHPHGASICIRNIGHSGFSGEQLAENIEAVWESLKLYVPGGIENIHSAYLKSSGSAAIPFFVSFTPPKEVPVGKFKEIPAPATDELSTLPGAIVTVSALGNIKVNMKPTEEDKEFIDNILKSRSKVNQKSRVNTNEQLEVDANEKSEVDANEKLELDEDEKPVVGTADRAKTNAVGADNAEVSDSNAKASKSINVKKQKDQKIIESESEDEDEDMMAAAEDEYLMEWSRAQSVKELSKTKEKGKGKKKKTSQSTRKPASKQTSEVEKGTLKLSKKKADDMKKVNNASPKNKTKRGSKKNVNKVLKKKA